MLNIQNGLTFKIMIRERHTKGHWTVFSGKLENIARKSWRNKTL